MPTSQSTETDTSPCKYRPSARAQTKDITSPQLGATGIRIQRHGDRISPRHSRQMGTWTSFAEQVVSLTDPVYVGPFVCPHNAQGLVTLTFNYVTIQLSAAGLRRSTTKEAI